MITPDIKKFNDTKIDTYPFPHIIVDNYIEPDIVYALNKSIYNTHNWELDVAPGLAEVYFIKNYDGDYFDYFTSDNHIKALFKKFNCNLPKTYYNSATLMVHKKNAELDIHTDCDEIAYENRSKYFNTTITKSLTQQLYLPDTDQYPETGVQLHKSYNDRTPLKQIKCLPGTYFAYPNNKISWHGIPKQKTQFIRMSFISRTYWN